MPKDKHLSDLAVIKKLKDEDVSGYFTNSVTIVKKIKKDESVVDSSLRWLSFYRERDKYETNWYLKKDKNHFTAVVEVIAQEIFRLFIPAHPKTRLVCDRGSHPSMLISKQVPGYLSLGEIDVKKLRRGILNGNYYGLGEVVIIAFLVNEIDLKIHNLCVNEKNQIIKLDGDHCFKRLRVMREKKQENKDSDEVKSEMREFKEHHVCAEDLENITDMTKYMPTNWLEGYEKDSAIDESPRVRVEMHRTLLKVILMPDNMLREFTNYISSEEGELFSRELINRKKMLRDAALKLSGFREYMQSEVALKDQHDFIDHLRNFKLASKDQLTLVENGKYIERSFRRLKNAIAEEALNIEEAQVAVNKP